MEIVFDFLRLHQRNTESSAENQSDSDCNEPESLIRVTLSIMVRRNFRGGNHRHGGNTNSGVVRRGNYCNKAKQKNHISFHLFAAHL